jgi:hypothetical protein
MQALELELHITDLGFLMTTAYDDKDFEQAREWLSLQTQAIKARSKITIKRLEIERGLVLTTVNCYTSKLTVKGS